MIKNYPEKPGRVDACQYDGTNHQEIINWSPEIRYDAATGQLKYGPRTLVASDWVLLDMGGNWHVYIDSQFRGIYQV